MLTSSVMPPQSLQFTFSRFVHIDTSNPTCNHVDRVYHATSISGNLLSWCHNRPILLAYDPIPRRHISIQALIGNVLYVCLCKCTITYITHQFIITINSHQAYLIILTQHLINYTTRLKVSRQWPLAAVKYNLATAEQQSRYSGTTISLQ